jgi:hypothetical protein
VDNIKMDLREREWDGIDWIDLAQDRDQRRALVNTVMNLRVPENAEKFLNSCTSGSSSRRAQFHEWVRVRKPLNCVVRTVRLCSRFELVTAQIQVISVSADAKFAVERCKATNLSRRNGLCSGGRGRALNLAGLKNFKSLPLSKFLPSTIQTRDYLSWPIWLTRW